MSQPFILNDERLMGQSNHRMPVAVEKGVEGRTAGSLIFLSLGEGAKDLTKGDPCRQSKDFNNEQTKKKKKKRKEKKGILCSHPEVGVAFHSRFQKREKRKLRKRETKTKQLITSHPGKELRRPKPHTRIDIFPPS